MIPRSIDRDPACQQEGSRDELLDNYGAFGAIPAVIAFWVLVCTAGVLGWAVYDALIAGLL